MVIHKKVNSYFKNKYFLNKPVKAWIKSKQPTMIKEVANTSVTFKIRSVHLGKWKGETQLRKHLGYYTSAWLKKEDKSKIKVNKWSVALEKALTVETTRNQLLFR